MLKRLIWTFVFEIKMALNLINAIINNSKYDELTYTDIYRIVSSLVSSDTEVNYFKGIYPAGHLMNIEHYPNKSVLNVYGDHIKRSIKKRDWNKCFDVEQILKGVVKHELRHIEQWNALMQKYDYETVTRMYNVDKNRYYSLQITEQDAHMVEMGEKRPISIFVQEMEELLAC